MSPYNPQAKILGYILTFIVTMAIAIYSKQNPRIILYSHVFSEIFSLTTIWIFAASSNAKGYKGFIADRFTREPLKWERSKPYKDERTRKPSGIMGYIFGLLTLLFMVGIILMLGTGSSFLSKKIIFSELCWSLLIALFFTGENLFNKKMIVAVKKDVPTNLGYNVGGINFLVAAVFITAFSLLIINISVLVIFGERTAAILAKQIAWFLLGTLTAIRFYYEYRHEQKLAGRRTGRLP